MKTTIIHGPIGCGKTLNAQKFMQYFGAARLVDPWDGRALQAGDLALVSSVRPDDFSVPPGAVAVDFETACSLAGISDPAREGRPAPGGSMTTTIPIHIDSDLAPLEAAMLALQRLADSDPDAVRAFFEELEASGDVERQLLRIDGEQRTTDGAGYVRIVFEPSERLAEFLVAARANNVLE